MNDTPLLGMVTTPSIAAVKAGALQLSLGLINDDGELRPFIPLTNPANPTSSDPFSDTIPFPSLQFGMVKVGTLTFSDSFTLPAVMASSNTGNSGSGVSNVHSTTANVAADLSSAAIAVNKAVAQAISQQIEASGFFYQPFYLRYALRMTNGTHQCLSAPVLMNPWALPPCLALASNVPSSDGSTSTVSFNGTTFPYFKLTCLIGSSIPMSWTTKIAGVDVFISTPILTYRPDQVCTDGLISYAQMAQALLGTSSTDIYTGTWSEDNGTSFLEHSLQDCGLLSTRAWSFPVNPAYKHQFTETAEFYKVAFIPISKIVINSSFDISIPSTEAASLMRCQPLEDSLTGHLKIRPAVSLIHCDCIFALGGSQQIMPPLPLCASIARCNDISLLTTTTIVRLRRDGHEYNVASQSTAPDLTLAFPRYLFMPIQGAFSLTIIQNNQQWTLSLTPHSYLAGAYWIRDQLSSAPLPVANNISADLSDQWVETKNLLQMYDLEHLTLLSSCRVGKGDALTILPSVKSVSQGQFGQYPLYVFSTDGIWAIPVNKNTLDMPQLISTDCLSSADAAVLTPEGVAYATAKCVKLLSGAKVQCFSHPIKSPFMEGIVLPHWSTVLTLTGITCAIPSLSNVLDNPRLQYDDSTHRLWIWNNNFGFAFVYSFPGERWAMSAAPNSGNIPRLIVTAPLKCAGQLKEIKICGLFPGNKPQVFVYGSLDLQGWSLVASGEAISLKGLDGTAFTYYIVVIIPAVNSCLYSVDLISSD